MNRFDRPACSRSRFCRPLRTLPIALLLWMGLVSIASAVEFSLSPANRIAAPGDTLVFSLLASDPAPVVLGGFDIDVTFDASGVSVVQFAPTPVLGDLSLGEAFDFSFGDVTPGVLNLAVLSTLDAATLGPLQQGTFALASFSVALGPSPPPGGTARLSLSVNALSDGAGIPVVATSLEGATITVIPEPGSSVLLGVGLAGLAHVRSAVPRRRPRRAKAAPDEVMER